MTDDLTPVPSRTPDELKQFVKDVLANKIFVHQMIDDPNLCGSVFMVLKLGGLGSLDPASIGTVYEYLDQAGPLGINGYPIFLSCRFLNKEDWAKTVEVVRIEQQRRNDLLDATFSDLEPKKDIP